MVDWSSVVCSSDLKRLAPIVRGADTGRPDLVPEAAGLLAASLGLSRMYADDLEQLEAGMLLYDAFYRWCRDATDETHNWVSHQPAKSRAKAKRSEEHTSELQSLMRISYAVFCLKKKNQKS